jgi:hypothetical protein
MRANVLVVPEQSELLFADLDGAAAELGDKDLVAGLDAQRYPLAVLVVEAGADGEYLALVELLDGAVGEEDAGGGLGLGLHALHQDAVEERCEGLDVLEHGLMEGDGVSGCCRLIDVDGPDALTMMTDVKGVEWLMRIGECRCSWSDY